MQLHASLDTLLHLDADDQSKLTTQKLVGCTVQHTGILFKTKASSFKSKTKHTTNVIKEDNEKVLLRERKRHTARRVESTPSVVLTGYPPPVLTWLGGGGGGGVPPPPPRLDLAGYPPRLPHGILGNVAKHYGIWVPPPQVWTDKVKLLPSRRTTYAGGKNNC